jgi:hypothetical protein
MNQNSGTQERAKGGKEGIAAGRLIRKPGNPRK